MVVAARRAHGGAVETFQGTTMTDQDFLPDALWTGRFFTGQWVESTHTQPVLEPASGASLGQLGQADAAQISRSAADARSAQQAWANASYEARAQVLRRAAQLSEQYAPQIVEWLVRESGSIQAKAGFEASISTKVLHEAAALPSRAVGEVLPSTPGRLTLARRKPLGVVGVIAPFNFPLYLAIRAVAPALALGNAVVLKPDPRTAVCGGFVIARLFELAGLPAGLLHVLPGDGAAGAALTSDPNIAMIQFTGSTGAGRKVGEAAGKHLKKVSLELGGKNSLIVLDDADLDLAIANTTWGVYLHQGQICMATGRVLVQRGIYDRFLERLVAKAKSLVVGDPSKGQVHLGPLINAVQRDHVAKVVADAVAAGATLEAGGQYQDLFFQATVLSGVTPANPAFHDEIFGPVAVVVPFDTDEEAIALANDSEYGLSMAVLSGNVGRALKLGEQLRTGLLHINDQTVNDDVINPFGGVGASGNGTSIGGPANIEEFTQWQWLTIKGEPTAYPL
jgi:benzaldehyde dehydrogenase (NAD)